MMIEAAKQTGFWFNMNYQVTVFLTEDGAHVLNHRFDKYNQLFPGVLSPPDPPYVAGQQYETQLWSLMQDFGALIGMGQPNVFEGNKIFFEANGIGEAEPPTPLPDEPCDDDDA